VVGEGLAEFLDGRVDVKGVEEEGLKDAMEGVDAAKGDRADSVAVICVTQGEKLRAMCETA
jgi:hypothetical protein